MPGQTTIDAGRASPVRRQAGAGRRVTFAVPKPVLLALPGVLLLGAHLRFQAVLHTEIDVPLRADARDYFLYAVNLVEHGTYSREAAGANTPDALRSPGYPAFIAPLLAGQSDVGRVLLRIHLAQTLVSVLTIALAFLLARRMAGDAAAPGVALLVAASPHPTSGR